MNLHQALTKELRNLELSSEIASLEKMRDADGDHWITTENGKHVLLGEGGVIKGGSVPKSAQGESIKEFGKSGASGSKSDKPSAESIEKFSQTRHVSAKEKLLTAKEMYERGNLTQSEYKNILIDAIKLKELPKVSEFIGRTPEERVAKGEERRKYEEGKAKYDKPKPKSENEPFAHKNNLSYKELTGMNQGEPKVESKTPNWRNNLSPDSQKMINRGERTGNMGMITEELTYALEEGDISEEEYDAALKEYKEYEESNHDSMPVSFRIG